MVSGTVTPAVGQIARWRRTELIETQITRIAVSAGTAHPRTDARLGVEQRGHAAPVDTG